MAFGLNRVELIGALSRLSVFRDFVTDNILILRSYLEELAERCSPPSDSQHMVNTHA